MYHGLKHDEVLIVGAGSTLVSQRDKLIRFCQKEVVKTIGINNMTTFCHPTYHLWTNTQRYKDFGKCINADKSILMFGSNISQKTIKLHHSGNYISVKYSDKENYVIKEQNIEGRFRTAGLLAIAIAHLMEAKKIWVAGMDGYTLQPQDRLLRGKRSQHCYGTGFTDDANWKSAKQKDNEVQKSLDQLSKIIEFEIITPTKFENHYNSSILEKY